MKTAQPSPATFQPGRHLEMFDPAGVDPYQARAKLSGPATCPDCGVVYHDGRWQWLAAVPDAATVRCPACHRIADKMPAGYVSIDGQFALEHQDELLALIRKLAAREKAEHPMQRIMAIAPQGEGLLVTTTDLHLARGIGQALEDAYKGELEFHYNRDEHLLRLHWKR